MNINEGNKILLELAKKYLSDNDLIDEIERVIASLPKRVAVRGVFEIINNNKIKPFNKEDKEKLDDLFYFFG